MESSPHSGDKSVRLEDRDLVNIDIRSITKRPCTVLLEEKIEDNFQPSEEELLEYALWLGMTIPRDMDLIWIARDGLTQRLPDQWKPCQTDDDEIYYFNFETGESVWDHPCDGLYRKLYQEECKKLGKRPYQIRENSNWGESSTYLQPSHQVNYNDKLNEKEKHTSREPPLQDDIGFERFPSNKEIQMNIVEKEIDSLKGIRDQLLQKINAVLWEGEQFPTLGNELVVERVAKFNQVEQNNGSLLEGRKEAIPSVEMDHITQLNTHCSGKNWNNIQLDEKEDPRKTKARTDMLRKQLEMAKMIPPLLANRVADEHMNDSRQTYMDNQRYENQINRGPPMKYASNVSQEANGKHSLVSDGKDVIHSRVMEELKKEELLIVDEMKERILMQVRKSMEALERSTFEEYELMLTIKRNKLELLRKELRKDMEFELLLEEELILKRKKEELVTRLHNQVGNESCVAHTARKGTNHTKVVNGIENRVVLPKDETILETLRIEKSLDSIGLDNEAFTATIPLPRADNFMTKTSEVQRKGKEAVHSRVCDEDARHEDEKNAILEIRGVSSHLNSAPTGSGQGQGIDGDLKELFLQCRRELRDDISSLQSKINQILVLHAKANQLDLETSPILSIVPLEDNCKASHNVLPVDDNATQLLYTLRRSIGGLDANLKHLLEERKVGLHIKNNAHVKTQQYKPPTQNDENMNGRHLGGDISTDTLFILKELLVVVCKELEKNTNHLAEEVIKNNKSKLHNLPGGGDHGALDTKTKDRMSTETSLILKSLVENSEQHLGHQTTQQEGKYADKTHGCGPSRVEMLAPEYCQESQFMSLHEDLCEKMLDVHGIVTQFKTISTDMISSLKGFIGQLEIGSKEKHLQYPREVKCGGNCSRRHNESKRYGGGTVKDQQTLPNYEADYAINKASKVTSGENAYFEKLSVSTLGMLERFIGTLYYEVRDHISSRGNREAAPEAAKEICSLQMDSKHEASLQEVKHISAGHNCGTSRVLGVSYTAGPSAKGLRQNSKGLVDGLHQGISASSIEEKDNTVEDKISTFPTPVFPTRAARATTEDDKFLWLLENNSDIRSVLPKMGWGDYPNLELDKLSTKSLHDMGIFQNEQYEDSPDQVVRGTREPELDATKVLFENLDDICASSPDGTSVDASGISTTQEQMKKPQDADSITYDSMHKGLKGFIAEVDEELKAIIQNCTRKLKTESGTTGSEMKDIEYPEVDSQGEETELESHSFIPLLKAWSTEIEKSTHHLLQHFQNELMEMNRLQQKKANQEHSAPSSGKCDKLQPQKPQHLTQVQTLVAEEKRIWYDILNDATKQWLQKEWVERLEHQSDLATTCDNSTSPPHSESLIQVQKMLGEDKNIVCYGVRNHSTQKWLVHDRNPFGSHQTSEVKQSAQETIESLRRDSFKDEDSPYETSRQKYGTPNSLLARNDSARKTMNGRSHAVLEEERQSNPFTNDMQIMGHHSKNFNFSMIPSSCSGKEDGSNCGYQIDQKVKPLCNISRSQGNSSSINHWITKTEPFGAFNHKNEAGDLQEHGLCEECQTQNTIMRGVKREAQSNDTRRIKVIRTISQLKLVSRQSWKNLQSKLRVAQAVRWAHMIGSWAIEHMSCGLLFNRDCSYPTLAMKKSIRAILEKLTCGKAHLEDYEDEILRDSNKGSAPDDPGNNTIQKYYNCYPAIKPYLTRPTNLKIENRNISISPVDLPSFHKQNSSMSYEEATHDFPGLRRFDALTNMDDTHELGMKPDPEKIHSAESIENSFVKYQSDDDIALSNVENTQCDLQTPLTSSINLREVDMHELEEAINNLRKSRELDAKGKLLWANHFRHRDDNHYEDGKQDYDISAPSTYEREFDDFKPFDFGNEDQDVNQIPSNSSRYRNNKNGHMKEEVPKFITFEILQQGEIGFHETNINLLK